MKTYLRLVALFLALFSALPLLATNMTIGRIEMPSGTIAAGKPTPIRFWVKNTNVLDANAYTLTASITLKGSASILYQSVFSGTNLKKFDSTLVTAPTGFTPLNPGEYEITCRVDFAEDIDHSDDAKKGTFTAIAPPNLGTRIRQFNYFSPRGDSLSTMGIIEFTVPPQSAPKFLNVLIRRNDTSEAVWIARNLLFLPPAFTPQNPIGMFIDFKRIGLQPGEDADSVILCVFCTDTPLSEAPAPDVTCEWYDVKPDVYAVGEGSVENAAGNNPQWFIGDSLPTFLATPTLTDTVERACTMPNIDLVDTAHPYVDGGYGGDLNACGPAAVANSMEWLEKSFPGRINSGLTHREKLEEIASFCPRDPTGNVAFVDLIKAKLAFIDKHKLPIKVKYQAVWGDTTDMPSPDPRYGHSADYQGGGGNRLDPKRAPKWDWTVKEMQDSEDVEMFVGYWDQNLQRTNGHYVVITGTAVINGVKQIRFKEDQNQNVVGGTAMPSVFWKVHSSGWPYIPDLSSETSTCLIEGMISESYDTTVKFVETGVADILKDRNFLITIEKNPTQRTESVAFDLFIGEGGKYRIALYDLTGREIALLADEYFVFGAKRYYWDGMTTTKTLAPTGIYFLSVIGEGRREMVKVVRY